ncbi:hypothetical protein LP52_12355 [Streptomonospora alba]|uniref:HTH araC/xylS-type domain-containing protein n=1 Tax=Streptomonospora alba TaxID=183763 RepID=A0A0C2FH59_9ACTN|nr:helix-turn-helix transcriptional regulator [Streptomonospora alba]KIH98609.1 hypothetical protein LP52_12355 [Streptomonospora alba]
MEETTGAWAAALPHPALRGVVKPYVAYATSAAAPSVHAGLPSRYLTFIAALDDPLHIIGGPGSENGPRTVEAGVGGLHLRPVQIAQRTPQRGVHVSVDPMAARALFGVPAAELAGTTVEIEALPVSWARDLPERLAEACGWRDVFERLDRALMEGRVGYTVAPEVRHAWELLVRTGGRVPVHRVAREVGWSRRHLGERFAAEVGTTPKQAARVIRFERSAAALRAGARDLAAVSAACGYYDQAYMNREWRAMAECTPTEWMCEELPFLQDGDIGPVPESRPWTR